MCYIYLRLFFGIACLAYHTAIKFALYQLLYPEFIVNSFDIKRAAATFVQFVAHSMANINIFMIAKARDKASKDFSHMKQINNEHGLILRNLDMIIGRWKGYFDKLLNEENTRSNFDDGVPNKGLTQGISRNEVKLAISRMKNGKATGMDGIPVEVWTCLGEEGIDMLWDLMKGYTSKRKYQRSGEIV